MDPSLPEAELKDSLRARPYQSELEDIAFKRNTIIHLPTGSGKTFIAISLINRLSDSLKKPWGSGGKRCFFLVNTIPLVKQQKEVIEKLTNVDSVAGYSGEDGVDYWDKNKWDAELTKHQVIVMTAQILADMLTHAYLRLENINLIIFDECHHAVDDHPMRVVMRHFENCSPALHPRVVGLTATLLNANVSWNNVANSLRELETTFHATIATVNSLGDVMDYSTNPNESILYYKKWQLNGAAMEAIDILTNLMDLVMSVNLPRVTGNPNIRLEEQQRDISSDPKKIIKEVKNMIVSMKTLIEELGSFGGSLAILAYITLLDRLKRKALSCEEERLYKMTSSQCLTARMILLKSMKMYNGFEKIVRFSSPKVIILLKILKEYNPEVYNSPGVVLKVNTNRKPLSSIIFTKQRFCAKVLYNLLDEVRKANPKDYGFLEHDFIVGFNINPYKNTREQYFVKRSSETALLKFRREELNCLIATNVIEEGVDIQQCLLVLRYDPPVEYRSYVQSKGRARSSESAYVMLIDEENANKFKNLYVSFQETERYIQKLLIGKTDCRGAPTLEDIQEDLYDDDDIPPYVTANGTRLLPASAISLLNRYCATLPRDQFTTLAPMWTQELVNTQNGQFRLIKIYMPIACPIKEPIAGIPMANLKSARRSAALNACIRLHEAGELDYYTLLPKPFGAVDFDEVDMKEIFPNWPDSSVPHLENTGTKKCVRKHKKVFSKFLQGKGNTKESQTFYLHIIQTKPAFTEPTDPRERALYMLLKRHEGYGLLTLNPLPKICDFPMFMTAGEVDTSLLMNYAVIQLDATMFELIKRFHYLIFNSVLEVAKKFVVFDGTENCLYVVPVVNNDGYDIDWRTMQMHTYIPPVMEPTNEERKRLRVTKEDYLHQVITPWYRPSLYPDRYIVSNVLEYLTPSSNFASDYENTFADYYQNKYKLDILGRKDQPLLEVRNISSRMNCLLPRANTIRSFTEKQQRMLSQIHGDDKPKGFPEMLIPEFCIKYEFPGVLWYKAMMLPSICHRVLSLLVAHEFRAEIAKGIKCGQASIKQHEDWEPIKVDMDAVISGMLSQIEDPPPICKIDRINDPIDQNAPRPPPRDSARESLAQLQKKKIDEEYPWDESQEPIDIERNLTSVTLMDIECYDKFVSAIMPTAAKKKPQTAPAVIATHYAASAAIMPPPPEYVDKIKLISKKPSVRGPELRDVLAALTTAKARDSFNMERVETLGDSFLKFAASLYLFHKFPTYDEGRLTTIKCRMIGNRNLFYAGVNKNLPGRMKVETFIPRKDFLVPGYFAPKEIENFIEMKGIRPTFLVGMIFDESEALSGQLSDESLELLYQRCNDSELEEEPPGGAQPTMQCYARAQAVSDKSVADCVEAIVGTYLLDSGLIAAGRVLEWFNILPSNEEKFENILKKRVPTALSENRTTLEEVHRVLNNSRENVEKILQYKFKDPSLLLEALSHTSYIRNRITRNYGRLEFLGDAILDFLITSYIFETCPNLKPGELTDLRSALVNNVTFAAYVVKLSLQKYMCYLMTSTLSNAIMSFVSHQENRNFAIEEDVLYLIDEEDCHIADYVEVPKIISDTFESLAGAIYLDSGGDLEAVWAVYYRIMHNEIAAFSRNIPKQPVRLLHENMYACARFGDPIPLKNLPKVSVPVTFTKNGRQEKVYGFGRNKSQAKRAAAKMALQILK